MAPEKTAFPKCARDADAALQRRGCGVQTPATKERGLKREADQTFKVALAVRISTQHLEFSQRQDGSSDRRKRQICVAGRKDKALGCGSHSGKLGHQVCEYTAENDTGEIEVVKAWVLNGAHHSIAAEIRAYKIPFLIISVLARTGFRRSIARHRLDWRCFG